MKIRYDTDCRKDVKKLIEKVFNYAAKYFSLPLKSEICIAFLSEGEIKEVNAFARDTDSVTDVLSFPYLENIKGRKIDPAGFKTDINPETGCLMLGEINICLARASEQAQEYGHSFERECAYLALHGLLHILGYDHIEEADKGEMREKEEEILGGLNIGRRP